VLIILFETFFLLQT